MSISHWYITLLHHLVLFYIHILFFVASFTTHAEPTFFYITMTTTSAVVEPTLDSRAQPVATEHAVPLTPTQFSSSLVAGMQ